jgi:hypothetical protein
MDPQTINGKPRVVGVHVAVRALPIGAIGLTLDLFAQFNEINGILPFYAVLFLLAIPLLGIRPLILASIAAAVIALGPVLVVTMVRAGLPNFGSEAEPNLGTLVHDPLGLLAVTARIVASVLLYPPGGLAADRTEPHTNET